MTDITPEMQEKLAIAVGFKWHKQRDYVHGPLMHGGYWSEGHWDYKGQCTIDSYYISKVPDLTDLTNLFKWVVPELWERRLWVQLNCSGSLGTNTRILKGEGVHKEVSHAKDELPGHALFLACYKLLVEAEDGE